MVKHTNSWSLQIIISIQQKYNLRCTCLQMVFSLSCGSLWSLLLTWSSSSSSSLSSSLSDKKFPFCTIQNQRVSQTERKSPSPNPKTLSHKICITFFWEYSQGSEHSNQHQCKVFFFFTLDGYNMSVCRLLMGKVITRHVSW